MLRPMRLVEQWTRIELRLPENWADARLELTIGDDTQRERASALLGPLVPGLAGKKIRFYASRRGAGPGLEAVKRALTRLDEEQLEGRLELIGVGEPAAPATAATYASNAAAWREALSRLPADWSDLYAEIEFRSSDDFERAALLMAPLNPARFAGTPGFRFRVARRFGYGAAAEMVERCLERLDEDGIEGELRVLRAISDSRPVDTQGPVWRVGGRAV